MSGSRSASAGLLGLLALVSCSKTSSISGTISGATGVLLEIVGPERVTSTTGRDGGFSFGDLSSGQYVLTPSLAGYSFTPPARTVRVDGTSVTGQDFVAEGKSGVLDVLFGAGGKVILAPSDSSREDPSALAIQPDGRILATTNSQLKPGLTPAARVVRFLVDGTVDPTFGSDGIATLGVSGLECYGQAMALAPDGRIVVAGGCHDPAGPGPIYLARLEADGGPDRAFGDAGTVLLQVRRYGTANAVTVVPDGRIVIAGTAEEPNSDSEVILARYLPEGRLDPSFGDAGLAADGLPGSVSALASQEDGKLVVAGAQGKHTLVARFEASGWLDLAFADGGVASPPPFPTPWNLTPPGEAELDAASALVVEPGGQIIAVGLAAQLSTAWLTFARWTPDGAPDPLVHATPGPPGMVSLPFFLSSVANTVGVDPLGNLVIGGYSQQASPTSGGALLFRYHDDGTLDSTFGTDGYVAEQAPPGTSDVRAVARQPDGKIVAAGSGYGTLVLRRVWP
jgi:uncharacterized delta-60 repeat protein